MKKILIILLLIYCKAEAQNHVSQSVADSLYATGNYAKAINYYAEEGSVNVALQIARAYNVIGNYDKSILQYQCVVTENPEFQIASFELGKLLLKSKAFYDARKLFSELVKQAQDNPEYQYYLGEVYSELDQPASSLIAYK